ncbi:hypothetical protein, partial [Schlesneria sp.]|uniref:hypothetical protein n=1 Tax=Schlesneria sp. TaxID=2762018 RepID=UPI002EE04C57
MATNNSDDPTATYRGYRRQALYVLFRLFDEGLPSDSKIHPEGEEDLAIYGKNAQLTEVIQVKDLSDPLSVSSFKRSFFERIKTHCAPGTGTEVKIVSYGPIGPELEEALGGEPDKAAKVVSKLTEAKTKETAKKGKVHTTTIPGLSPAEADSIVKRLQICKVTEPDLREAVIERLKNVATGTDPARAFDLLMWWMLTCSEEQRVISREMAIAKLDRIGKFLTARAAYHNQWNRSIIPIAAADLTAKHKERLEESFYRGGRVRFEHIVAGLDVPRGSTATDIDAAFDECNVVILHSASGQGKTTQAYRYAKDYAPKDFRFEVLPPDDLAHARDMALAIVGHAEAIEVPTFVYVDVRPGDQYWVELVRQLAKIAGIRVLVTIREEDWARTAVSAADFDYKELTLAFGENEASELYNRLLNRGIEQKHLDFNDAWEQFGTRKTLFEFVYYVTQHQSLADRIKSQMATIEVAVSEGRRPAAELEFLRKVAVASAYEARVDLASLLAASGLPAAHATITTFEDEYLIRVSEDGKYVEGFHAIRSELMTESLVDPIIYPWYQVATQVLPHIVEDDLESFLLCAFSRRPDSATQLIDALCTYSPKTWVGVRNIMVALMWNGLQSYTQNNLELLREVHDTCIGWWSMALDWDLAMAKGPKGFNVFENLGDAWSDAKKNSDKFRSRQLDKSEVFGDVRAWAGAKKRLVDAPTTPQTWLSMAEVLFWVGHLSITTELTQNVAFSRMNEGIESLTTYQLGRFLLGVRTCFPDDYARWLNDSSAIVRGKIRSEAAFLILQDNPNDIVGHFLIDPEVESNTLRRSDDRGKAAVTIHDLTIERIEVLAQVFPAKERYGAVGYGHRSSLVPPYIDEANKPGVLSENLYPHWTTTFNARARGYVELMFRPETWRDYFAIVAGLRQSVIDALLDLELSTKKIIRASSPPRESILNDPAGWDACKKSLQFDLLLPKVAVDEWGFASDSSSEMPSLTQKTFRTAINRFTPVKESLKEYTRTVGNFMRQALESMILVPNLRHAQSHTGRVAVVKKAAELGLSEDSVQLSIVNGIDSFKAVVAMQDTIRKIFPDGDLPGIDRDLRESELRAFDSAITTWCNFVSPPRMEGKGDRRSKDKKIATKAVATTLGDLLSATRNRLKSELQALRAFGIKAGVQSESVRWNGRSALWIGYDVGHPIEVLQSVSHVWNRLVAAFNPDRDNIIRSRLIDCFWEEIILVPTVLGKSLDGIAMPHLKAVTYPVPPPFDESAWRMAGSEIDHDTLRQLGIELWPLPMADMSIHQLNASFAELFLALDHLSDLDRMNVELDDVGQNMLHVHLNRKMVDLARVLHSTRESVEGVAKIINSSHDIDSRPNLKACGELLVETINHLALPNTERTDGKMTISEIVEWRDEVRNGLGWVGTAKYFWL